MVEKIIDLTHANANHLLLFRAGIPVIKTLANLDRVMQKSIKPHPQRASTHISNTSNAELHRTRLYCGHPQSMQRGA